MLQLKIGQEVTLYFNHKAHKGRICEIELGEIVWIQFEDQSEKQEYYHMDELKNLMNPENMDQMIENFEEELIGL